MTFPRSIHQNLVRAQITKKVEAIETALAEVIYQEKMRKFIEQTAGKFKLKGLN